MQTPPVSTPPVNRHDGRRSQRSMRQAHDLDEDAGQPEAEDDAGGDQPAQRRVDLVAGAVAVGVRGLRRFAHASVERANVVVESIGSSAYAGVEYSSSSRKVTASERIPLRKSVDSRAVITSVSRGIGSAPEVLRIVGHSRFPIKHARFGRWTMTTRRLVDCSPEPLASRATVHGVERTRLIR